MTTHTATTTATHTPGPWATEGDWWVDRLPVGRSHAATEIHAGGQPVGFWVDVENSGNCPNARLIAAAPELLTMLERVLCEYLQRDPENGPVCALTLEQARAAIAKACGE